MDYRKRQYYLIDILDDNLNNKFYMMKRIAPSLKLSSPYNHFKDGFDFDYGNIQNKWWTHTTIHALNTTHLASVKNDEHYLFREFLELATKANEIYFMRVDKRMLGQ
jgi:hypothetical protein